VTEPDTRDKTDREKLTEYAHELLAVPCPDISGVAAPELQVALKIIAKAAGQILKVAENLTT